MANFLVWVNSFNRCNMLKELLSDIEEELTHNVDVMVINDHSEEDYSDIKSKVKYYWKTKTNYGKEGYWKLISFGLQQIKEMDAYDYYIKTDDDMRLIGNFFDIAADLADNLRDYKWATIDILSAKKQRGKTLLGHPAEIFDNVYKYYRTQWVDMNFIFNPRVFPDKINKITSGKASSGVGLWLTRYFNRLRVNLYQSPFSLVIHGNHTSKMNTTERKKNPIITKQEV